MPITKESLVSDLPGVSPPQAVALNRLGITRVGELIAADYESVAVTLESFDEATRIIREAKKYTESGDSKAHVNAQANAQAQAAAAARAKTAPRHRPHPSGKPSGHGAPQAGHASHGAHTATRPHSPQPVQQGTRPVPVRFAGEAVTASHHSGQDSQSDAKGRNGGQQDEGVLGLALSYAARGIDLDSGDEARASLSRRLGAATFLLEHEAGEADAIAAVILEGVEDGSIPAATIGRDFGEPVAQLVEECATIRAVPVSPLGKLPRYYMEMAQKASVSARRICAAHQIAHLHLNAESAAAAGESRGGVVWYARLLLEALESGGPDPVVSLLRSSVDALSRVAA